MMAENLGLIIGDNIIQAVLVLILFGGFAMIQGGGLDRKVAIMVPGAILAACLVGSWMFILLSLIVGFVIFYPMLRRAFG
jgi:hypothetical protein